MNRSLLAGAALGAAAAPLVRQCLLVRFRRDVARLNGGDYAALLTNYADDAVLRFNPGPHRWAGDHVGKPAIERFLRDFVGARLQGEIKDFWIAGPPWALRMAVRFDDHAELGGERVYANKTALVFRTRWGKVVEHADFYEDTSRIDEFELRLREHGVLPAEALVSA